MLAARAVLRAFRDRRRQPAEDQAPAIVFGAGDAAEQLVRSMNRSAGSKYRAVAILDDDPHKARRRIDGVRVVGTRDDIARVAQEYEVDRLVIAVPSAGAQLIRQLDQEARSAGLHTFVLPPVSELIGGNATAGQIREVTEEDILGRRPIQTDLSAIGEVLGGKVVLVTGAGGSIGSELCRQIARFRPRRLVMLDRDESALHAVQLSISGKALLEGDDLELADIRDAERIAGGLRHGQAGCGVPRRGAQAPVAAGDVPAGGVEDERRGDAQRAARRAAVGRWHLHQHLDRQGSQPDLRAGLLQAHHRAADQRDRPAVDGDLCERPVRQRPGQSWVHARARSAHRSTPVVPSP